MVSHFSRFSSPSGYHGIVTNLQTCVLTSIVNAAGGCAVEDCGLAGSLGSSIIAKSSLKIVNTEIVLLQMHVAWGINMIFTDTYILIFRS